MESSETIINDKREKFKTTTFSNFNKKDARKNLQNAIYYNKQEEAFFWTCEMLCSNMLLEIWETFFILMSKYIHIHNPKLPLYIEKKYDEFRNIIGNDDNISIIRNNNKIRVVFCSITTVLCFSEKITILDNMSCKFTFKIETLYDNLKAPNINYVKMVFKNGDPAEYLVPFNEFIYHVTETKHKVDIVYWLNWIIEYDILCRKKKKTINCLSRDIYQNSRKALETNIIWVIWEIIFCVLEKQHFSKNTKNIINSLFNLFAVRYCVSVNKKRIYLICHSIELLLLDSETNYELPILKDNKCIMSLEQNINIVMKQIKIKEIASEPLTSNTKIDIYRDIYMNI